MGLYHSWSASSSPREMEGVWLRTMLLGIALGLPLNLLTLIVIEPLSLFAHRLGIDPFLVLSASIVTNWALVGMGVGHWRGRRSRTHA